MPHLIPTCTDSSKPACMCTKINGRRVRRTSLSYYSMGALTTTGHYNLVAPSGRWALDLGTCMVATWKVWLVQKRALRDFVHMLLRWSWLQSKLRIVDISLGVVTGGRLAGQHIWIQAMAMVLVSLRGIFTVDGHSVNQPNKSIILFAIYSSFHLLQH